MAVEIRFESYVILDTTNTFDTNKRWSKGFESYVILDTTNTIYFCCCFSCWFESYVILDILIRNTSSCVVLVVLMFIRHFKSRQILESR